MKVTTMRASYRCHRYQSAARKCHCARQRRMNARGDRIGPAGGIKKAKKWFRNTTKPSQAVSKLVFATSRRCLRDARRSVADVLAKNQAQTPIAKKSSAKINDTDE